MDEQTFNQIEEKSLRWKRGFYELFSVDFKIESDLSCDDMTYADIVAHYDGSMPLQSYAAGLLMMMHVEWPRLTAEDEKHLEEIEGWQKAKSIGYKLLSFNLSFCKRIFYRLSKQDKTLLVFGHYIGNSPIYEIWLLNERVNFNCEAQIFTTYQGMFTVRPVVSLQKAYERYPDLAAAEEQGKIRYLDEIMKI